MNSILIRHREHATPLRVLRPVGSAGWTRLVLDLKGIGLKALSAKSGERLLAVGASAHKAAVGGAGRRSASGRQSAPEPCPGVACDRVGVPYLGEGTSVVVLPGEVPEQTVGPHVRALVDVIGAHPMSPSAAGTLCGAATIVQEERRRSGALDTRALPLRLLNRKAESRHGVVGDVEARASTTRSAEED